MSDEMQAASSTAEAVDVFGGEQVSLAEFQKYRADGELPERFKLPEQAESEPADEPEKTAEPEGASPEPEPESDPDETQGLKPKTARRIQQLLEKTKELERKLAEKQDVKPESSPVTPEPQYTRAKPTQDGKGPDGNPYETYEAFIEDLADWKAEQRLEAAKRDAEQRESQKALQIKLDDARKRYDDADDVIFPAAKEIAESKIPEVVKRVFIDSDNYVDLCYVVGSDPAELKRFIALAQSNPRAAIGKVFEYERGIREELSPERDTNGQFKAKEAPAPKKTSAPKPPSPVSGTASRAFDVSDDSLSPEKWAQMRNKQLGKV